MTRKELIALLRKVAIDVGDPYNGSTSDVLYNLRKTQVEIMNAIPEIKEEIEAHYREMELDDPGYPMKRPWEEILDD